MKKKILITGGSGFIGSFLANKLASNYHVRLFLRTTPGKHIQYEYVVNNIEEAIVGVDIVIHCAGIAHAHKKYIKNVDKIRKANIELAIKFATESIKHNVKRFIFLSSIGVNGSYNETPFTEDDLPNPDNLYAQSKFEAEKALINLVATSKMDYVIIRPPMVYGPGAPGSFGKLINLILSGFPLPFKNVKNKKSFISIENLSDFIMQCMEHQNASNQLFLVSDNDDQSTTDLINLLSKALGKNVVLFYVNKHVFKFIFYLLRKDALYNSLFSSLEIDIGKARKLLEWEPKISFDKGITDSVAEYTVRK